MNLLNIDTEIANFRQKIIKTLKLQQLPDSDIPKQKALNQWVSAQLQKPKKERQDPKSIFTLNNKFLTDVMQKLIKYQQPPKPTQPTPNQPNKQFTNDAKKLAQHLRKGHIPKQFAFESKAIPAEIGELVQGLRGRNLGGYYGEVCGPLFMGGLYIVRREDFHGCIQQVKVNGLKLIIIEERVAHKYQRNLIQQIFGRVFRPKGSLSTVIKIQIPQQPPQTPYSIFCYIEDRQSIDEDNSRSLADLKVNGARLEIECGGVTIQVDPLNVLQLFLAEVLVLPVQTLVSDFVVRTVVGETGVVERVEMIKCNQQDHTQIAKQTSLRQHASLRNPLLYFSTYLHQHTIPIPTAKQPSTSRQLYANFYRCLQLVLRFLANDFDTSFDETCISSSICFNVEVFGAVWESFHRLAMLGDWMGEVMEPVKGVVTVGEVLGRFCGVFNQVSQAYVMAESYTAYKQFYNNVQMQSYLGTKVTKKSLQNYKNIYLPDTQLILPKLPQSAPQLYTQIFAPILLTCNLEYLNPIESCYILYFTTKYKYQYHPLPTDIEARWKQPGIWTKCVECLVRERGEGGALPFIDVGFDFLGYACGVDVYGLDAECFERVGNFEEGEGGIVGVGWFVDFVRENYQKKAEVILSSFIEKSIKHKKFKVCKALLAKKVKIRNFHQIIKFNQIPNDLDQPSKQTLSKTIQQDSPQMHRLFKWQQLMLVNLQKPSKQPKQQSIEVQSMDFGVLHLPKAVLESNIHNGRVVNNLSRKDYKFVAEREIAHVTFSCWNGKIANFYIQCSPFPLMAYFYRIFLNKLQIPQIMPYFTSFVYQNKFYHIIQHLQDSLNYTKGLTNFKEQQLNALTDQSLISQAIIISMILLPAKIDTKDIIICPTKAKTDQIFMIDWNSNYSKDFLHKYMGKVTLNTKNSLFLLSQMNNSIHRKTITKYSQLEIQKISQNIFQQCKNISIKANQLKAKYFHEQQADQTKYFQLLALIFEERFLFSVMERMFKVKRLFGKCQNIIERNLSYFKLLQALSSETSYYYQEIASLGNNLLDREKILFNQNYKRPFLQTSLVQFFGSFDKLQQKDYLFPLHYDKFNFEGPTENLVNVGKNVKKFLAFKSNQIPEKLIQFPNDTFQYFMKNCDISGLETQKKQKLLQVIKLKSKQHIQSKQKRLLPLSFIGIKSLDFIKEKNFASNFSFERVEQLSIQSCKLGEYQLNSLPKTIQNILYLQLRDITGLKYIGQSAIYGKPIQIKHLKTLTIVECNDLTSIDLKCDILENLQLRNNKSLQTINVYSLNLKNISISNIPSLIFENLGVYIIKGINVLVCKTSCQGDFIKLYADDYQTFLNNIMRYLLMKFFQSTESRYYMLITLLKLKEVDESLFAMAGLTNFKAVTSMFSKFSIDAQDKILVQILRIYFQNPFRKRISVTDVIQKTHANITIQRALRIINQAIGKASPVNLKTISQIKFQYAKNFFSKVNIKNVKTMVDRIKLDKNLLIVFQNIKQQHQKPEQQKECLQMRIDAIKYISIEKPQIQKVNLVFKKCIVKYTFLQNIFKGTKSIEQLIKPQQQSSIIEEAFNRQKSSQLYRMSLKEQKEKFIKIGMMSLEGCHIVNDKHRSLKSLESQFQQLSSQIQSQIQSKIQPQSVQQIVSKLNKQHNSKDIIPLSSVKILKIQECLVQDFQILQNFVNLTHLCLSKCAINLNKSKQKKKQGKQSTKQDIKHKIIIYKDLFKILSRKDIFILQLQCFFTQANSTQQWQQLFDQFCTLLMNMKKLNKLKLNKNYFTIKNLKKLQKILNQSNIQQLQLNQITFSFDHRLTNSTIMQVGNNDPQVASCFQSLFTQCKNLKSLSIQLNNQTALQNFIISVSKNQHLIDLKLYSIFQISSQLLSPLNANKTLQLISSNAQLPVWLLSHIKQNSKSVRKSKIKSKIQNDKDNTEEDNNPLNMSMSYVGGRGDSDFFKLGLSLDGGGVRGMLLATELNYLAERVGYPLHKIFDCIGGTSIGGILALASAGSLDGENPVADTNQLMLLFSKYGKDIFKKTQIMQLKSLFDTKYSSQSFQNLLKNYFKDCKLSNCLPETNVIVTAVNRVDNKDYIFKSMESLLNRDKDFYMRDVARATSAAPTYFPSAEIKNVNASVKLSLVDGGVGLNNPSKLVIDEIKKIANNSGIPQNYFLLSLGTGKLPSQVIPQYAGLKDLSPIIDSFTESAAYFVQRDLATNYKGHFLRVSPLINVKSKKDAQLDNTSEPIVEMYRQTGLEAARKYFESTVIFGKYRNLNLVEWLRENTVRKYEY